MKKLRNLRSAFVALAVVFMATAAHAQTTKVAALVPFNFVAGDRAYPAGNYLFDNKGPVLKVTNTEDAASTDMLLSHACEKSAPSEKTVVVFQQMGGAYFLQQIWVAGEARGRELPRSKAEMRLAQNHEKPESVIVAANIVK